MFDYLFFSFNNNCTKPKTTYFKEFYMGNLNKIKNNEN